MMPDYMESLVAKLGLDVVLEDLRKVVEDLAEHHGDSRLWLIEGDLETCVGDAKEWYSEN
jgi:hypothetical protein